MYNTEVFTCIFLDATRDNIHPFGSFIHSVSRCRTSVENTPALYVDIHYHDESINARKNSVH